MQVFFVVVVVISFFLSFFCTATFFSNSGAILSPSVSDQHHEQWCQLEKKGLWLNYSQSWGNGVKKTLHAKNKTKREVESAYHSWPVVGLSTFVKEDTVMYKGTALLHADRLVVQVVFKAWLSPLNPCLLIPFNDSCYHGLNSFGWNDCIIICMQNYVFPVVPV